MSKNKRPVTESELARIPHDAAAVLAFLHANGRPGNARGTITVVRPRRRIAEALGLTVRQFSRAEEHLTRQRVIKAVALTPRNEHEALLDIYRWTLQTEKEHT